MNPADRANPVMPLSTAQPAFLVPDWPAPAVVRAAFALRSGGVSAAPWARLKKAHLALRRRDYPLLGRLLGGMAPPARESRDEWLYLNFVLNENA